MEWPVFWTLLAQAGILFLPLMLVLYFFAGAITAGVKSVRSSSQINDVVDPPVFEPRRTPIYQTEREQ